MFGSFMPLEQSGIAFTKCVTRVTPKPGAEVGVASVTCPCVLADDDTATALYTGVPLGMS